MEAQQQQYENQHQYQTQNTTTTNSTSQSYDYYSTSQIQSYDPQSYYATYPQQQYDNQNNLDYNNNNPNSETTYASSAYYYPNYSTSYQTHDPNSIHPPGVPLSVDPQQTQVPNSQNYYYPSPQTHPYFQPGQPVYGGPVSQGGRSTRGRGRGTFGRGKGRGGRGVTPQAPAPSKPPPQMAWCELCRVDCNTPEILEKHKNGKKHLRNVKVFEELQNTSKPIMVTNQVSIAQPEPEGAQKLDMTEQSALSVVQPSEETVRPDFSGGRGGLKRKMKGGRGGKRARVSGTPQQMVPILCELCNVKCESQVIYQSHVAGKKHLSILKRYQGHKEALGEGVEALYPTIPNLPPPIPITSQTHQPVPQDAQALASMLLGQQNLRDPEAAQAAVTELLNQHGIHDAQTLLAQLIPYLLTQSQEPGSAPLTEAGFGSNDPYLQSQGLNKSTEAEGQNGEIKTELQSLAGVGTSNKPDHGPSEGGKVEAE